MILDCEFEFAFAFEFEFKLEFGELGLRLTSSASPKLCAGSVLTTNIFCPSGLCSKEARVMANDEETVVFPTPPLPPTNTVRGDVDVDVDDEVEEEEDVLDSSSTRVLMDWSGAGENGNRNG